MARLGVYRECLMDAVAVAICPTSREDIKDGVSLDIAKAIRCHGGGRLSMSRSSISTPTLSCRGEDKTGTYRLLAKATRRYMKAKILISRHTILHGVARLEHKRAAAVLAI